MLGTFSESVCSSQPWGVYKALAATSASIMHSHNARFVTTAYREVMIAAYPALVQSTEAGMVAIGMACAPSTPRPPAVGSAQAAWPARLAVTPLSGYLSIDSVLVCENVVAPAPVADARGVHAGQTPWAKGGERLSPIYLRPIPSSPP